MGYQPGTGNPRRARWPILGRMDADEPSTTADERAHNAVRKLVLGSFLRSTRDRSFREFVRRHLEGHDGVKKSETKEPRTSRKKRGPKK
jgi:hypothetical protein